MENWPIIEKLVLSALIGFLIGIEREKQKHKQKHLSFGGIRTFPLIALFGALSAQLSSLYHNQAMVIAAFATISLLIIATHIYYSFQYKHSGITSEISAIFTFLIGVSTVILPNIVSISSAILLALLLSLKKPLHKLSYDIGEAEFFAAIKFVVISFIVLPLLPDRTIDPWQLFNPYKTWLLAVIISAIGFAGYITVKFIGAKKGIYLTGFMGGIVSSTSTCVNFAQRAKKHPEVINEYRNGALLSYISSIIKVAFVLFILNKSLFYHTFPALLVFLCVGGLLSWILIKQTIQKSKKESHLKLKNPFTLKFALEFAAILTIVFILIQYAQKYFGTLGVYLTSILSGFAKIDAITVSMAELAGGTVTYQTASIAVMIGVFFSAFSKSIYMWIFGGKDFAKAAIPTMLVTGLSGLMTAII